MIPLQRFNVIQSIVETLDQEFVICNLGSPSQELYTLQDSERHFYMLGSMGLASSIGLGLSLGTSQKVVVIDGDGSVLMNLGSLATIANHAPPSLILVIIDNSAYGSTGDQPTHTAGVTDLAAIARGAGIQSVFEIEAQKATSTLQECLDSPGPHVLIVHTAPGGPKLPPIPLSSLFIRDRFMCAVANGQE